MRTKRLLFILLLLLIVQVPFIIPQVIHKNQGQSKSVGKVNDGQLINGYKLPFRGNNYKYFSGFSYFVLGRAYTHDRVYKAAIDCYTQCETDCPGIKFKVMECANRNGGRLFPHKTHQNGLSVDFMTPLTKNHRQKRFYDKIGIWRYLLAFDTEGKLKLNKKVSIDYETMAKHILCLDNAAGKNGLKIKKVIFKTDLKDNLFDTKSDKELKRRGIYFVQHLPKMINNLHDDHNHIDFDLIN